MRNVFLYAIVVSIFCVNSTHGQTASDLLSKYGKPVSAYSVSEHIWMTSNYTSDGQVCRMWVYPKSFAGETNYLGRQLPFDELNVVLNQLVPIQARGIKGASFGMTATGGGAAWTRYSYEKVTFVFVSPFKADGTPVIKPYQFSEQLSYPRKNSEVSPEANDDFLPSKVFKTQIVTITWNDRSCAER